MVGLAVTIWIHNSYQMEIVVHPQMASHRNGHAIPMISVIVPARNEARNIRRCIQALLAQDYPRFELIVVDDRSNDENSAHTGRNGWDLPKFANPAGH